jgi:hypothetical protein
MVRDQAYDALAIGGRQTLAGVGQTGGKSVNPEPAVRVEHNLDNGRVFEPGRDVGAERGPQHAGAAGLSFGPEGKSGHWRTPCG